jgi:hypothetical protein
MVAFAIVALVDVMLCISKPFFVKLNKKKSNLEFFKANSKEEELKKTA